MADSYSMKERAILAEHLIPDIKISDVDELVDLLMNGKVKPVWH